VHLKTWIVGVVFGAVTAAGVGIAYASVPDSTGVIHGCYNSTSYALRVLDTAKTAKCPTGQKALNWNQTGPAGVTVVARPRISAPTKLVYRTPTQIPLTGATWSQTATGIQTIYFEVTFSFDSACQGDSVDVTALVGDHNWGSSEFTLPTSSPATFRFGGGDRDFFFEPGVATTHTMTASALGECQSPTDSITVTELSADIVGVK
jgi:hypothetical protein